MQKREEIPRRTMRMARSKPRKRMLNVKKRRKRKKRTTCSGLGQVQTYAVGRRSGKRRKGLKNKPPRASPKLAPAQGWLHDGVETRSVKPQDQKDVERSVQRSFSSLPSLSLGRS
jgi:hypothetical protein